MAGTLLIGWLRQGNEANESTGWDPNRYNITGKTPVVLQQQQKGSAAPPPSPSAKPKKKKVKGPARAKDPVALSGGANMSDAGISVLSTLRTKFGSVALTPETNISFRRLEMEQPDQARLGEFALQDLGGEMEFIVATDETYDCPFSGMVSVAHQRENTKTIGTATPQMERVLRAQGNAASQNIDKLKRLNGCTVNIRRLGKYVLTDHLPQGDGVLSRDGSTLVLNKGLKVGAHASVQLQSGDKITFQPNHQTNGGEFSIYKCQMGTSLPDRQGNSANDSYQTCLSERIAQIDVAKEKSTDRNMYMDRLGRDRFKKSFLQKTFQQVDDVQFPPSMERPDVYCDDVARMARDGFPQKPGTRSYLGGDVGQKNPIEGTRMSVSLAADSHYGTQTKVENGRGGKGATNVIGPKHDPIISQERIERMKQPAGNITSNRGRAYTDMSGLRSYTDKWDRTKEPRVRDYRLQRNDVPDLSISQVLNTGKRGGIQKTDPYYDSKQPRKATLGEDRSHRQKGGYMDGGMLIHEINEHGGRKVSENKFRRETSLDVQQQMYEDQHQAGKDDKTTERNMRLYGVSKPVVRLTRLTRIPGVMAKRGLGDLGHDLMDAERPHEVVSRVDYDKDAASKRGVREDYGHFTNQYAAADDPHKKRYYENAVDRRGESDKMEFGRQQGQKPNYTFMGENRQQTQDHKYRREKSLNVQQAMYDGQHAAGLDGGTTVSRDLRHDIHKYQNPGAVAQRENAFQERIGNARATSHVRRGIDNAENPVVHPREDADLAALSSKDGSSLTARTSSLYSEHDERGVVESNKAFQQGMSAARENAFVAGINTATGRVAGAEQTVNLRETTNATRDHTRREWVEERKGVVISAENGVYTVRLDDGRVESTLRSNSLKKRTLLELEVGQKTSRGEVVAVATDGSASISLENGIVQDGVRLESTLSQATYEPGDQIIATVRRTALNNRDFLRTQPARYDNVIRTASVSHSGSKYNFEPRSMALPQNETGPEWYRDDTLKEEVDSSMLAQRLSKPVHHGKNEPVQKNATNALISTGFAGPEEGTKEQENLNYPVPPGNLIHRPDFVVHSEELPEDA